MEKLVFNEEIRENLLASVKWVNFLSIVCAVMAAMMAMAGVSFFMLPTIDGVPGYAIGIIYVLLPLLYVYPVKKMFDYVRNTRNALNCDLQDSLDESFRNMHSILRYWGILTIVMLVLYAVLIVVAICGVVFASIFLAQ